MKLKLIAVLLSCYASLSAHAQLIEVPHPVLDEYKPEVRMMLAGARGRFELMQLNAEAQQLGIAYGRLGIHYYAHSEQQAARSCFVNAAELDSTNYRWPYYLAVHYAETGDFSSAVTAFERVLELKRGDVPALTRLGQAQLELDQTDAAELSLKAALAADPGNAAALAGLARVAENREDSAGAIGLYKQALQLQPDATQLNYRLGQAYRRSGDIENARTHLQQRGDRIPTIEDPLLSFMNAHSKPAGSYLLLAQKEFAAGNLERASKFYDIAYAIDPTHLGAILGLSRLALLSGAHNQALQLIDRALAQEPDNSAGLQLKGLLAELAGDDDGALDFFQRSLASQNNAQTHVYVGNILMRRQQYKSAADHYDLAVANLGADAEVRYRAGMARIAAADCVAAEPLLLTAYEADPSSLKVVRALARIYATCIDSNAEQLAVAHRYAQLLYNGQPGLDSSETLAMTLAAMGNFDDAVDFQAQAIFEALKTGEIDIQPQLKLNMERYNDKRPAQSPWPAGHQVFSFVTVNSNDR